MKKVLLAFVMASTLFVGCQKDEVKKEEKKNYLEKELLCFFKYY